MENKRVAGIAIVGTGMLGRSLRNLLRFKCDRLVLTHLEHPTYRDSQVFDFFRDDIGQVKGFAETDIVILPAKIEFEEDSIKLTAAMRRFLERCAGKRVVYVSSDGIFDGQRGMYAETDEPHPVTCYGRNLAACERLVQELVPDHCIARPSYLYGYSAGVLDSRTWKVQEGLLNGAKVKRFTDMFKSPLSYRQAAEVIASLALGSYRGMVHVAGPRLSVYAFTKAAMEALHIPTKRLAGESMPKGRPEEFLPDTSLNFDRMVELTGIAPLPVKESFSQN